MRGKILIGIAAACLAATAALANYTFRDASNQTQTMFTFVCFNILCPASVPIDSAGSEKATLANPWFDKSIQIDGGGVEKGTIGNPQIVAGTVVGGDDPWTYVGNCTLPVTSSTVLAGCSGGIPAGATKALINVEGAFVRSTQDGVTVPTSSVGIRLYPGSQWSFVPNTLAAIKFTCETTGCVANVSFAK